MLCVVGNITMTIIRAIVVALFALSGANAGSLNSYDSVTSWFKDNREQLNSLVGVLLAHPAIKRVDGKLGLEFITQYDELSDTDLEIYEKVTKQSEKLGIGSVLVSRKGSRVDGELISIRMDLVSKGNVVRGYLLALEYIPDRNFIEIFKSHGIDYYQLDSINGWYLSEYTND